MTNIRYIYQIRQTDRQTDRRTEIKQTDEQKYVAPDKTNRQINRNLSHVTAQTDMRTEICYLGLKKQRERDKPTMNINSLYLLQ
jgi:hypothetical protein